MNNKLLFMVFVLIIVLSINRSVPSQDLHNTRWPQFRGPNSSGVAHPNQNPPMKPVKTRYVAVFKQQPDGTWKAHRWLGQQLAQ